VQARKETQMLVKPMKAVLAVTMVVLMLGSASLFLVAADSHGAMTELAPGAQHWYTLTYPGSGTVDVSMDVEPASGAGFLILTSDAVRAWEGGAELAATGRGTHNPHEDADLFWSGDLGQAGDFSLVVEYTGDGSAPSYYSLAVSGAEVSSEAVTEDGLPAGADGIWCYTPNLGNLNVLDIGAYPPGKVFISATYRGEWTGVFHGGDSPEDVAVSEDTGLAVGHEIPDPTGFFPMLFVGTVSFADVQVGSASGGLEMDVAADILGASPAEFTEWRGSWIITSGRGDLSNLRGHGTWWGPGWQGDPNECGIIYYSVDSMSGP
jgi:hypothetical protein